MKVMCINDNWTEPHPLHPVRLGIYTVIQVIQHIRSDWYYYILDGAFPKMAYDCEHFIQINDEPTSTDISEYELSKRPLIFV